MKRYVMKRYELRKTGKMMAAAAAANRRSKVMANAMRMLKVERTYVELAFTAGEKRLNRWLDNAESMLARALDALDAGFAVKEGEASDA